MLCMNNVQIVRKTIPITFSAQLESQLLNFPSNHESLTHDLEFHARRGLSLLEELEDVHDLKHIEAIKELVTKTNDYSQMTSEYFTSWHIAIDEVLLDELDLLKLTHGEDLQSLGLVDSSQGKLLIFAVSASFHLTKPLRSVNTKSELLSEKLKLSIQNRRSIL